MSTKSLQQVQAETTASEPSVLQRFAFEQYLGNQAEAASVTAPAEESSYIGSFASNVTSDAPGVGDWSTSYDDSPSAYATPASKILEAPKIASTTYDGTDGGDISLSGSGVSGAWGTRSKTEGDDVLGGDTTDVQTTGAVDANGKLTLGRRFSKRMFDTGKNDGLNLSGGVTVDTEGKVNAGGAAVVDGVAGGSLDVMVDFGDHGVEAAGLTVGGTLGKASVSSGAYVRASDVEVDGTGVTWSSGFGANGGASYDGTGGSASVDRSAKDTVTFPTPQDAQAYGERVRAGEVGDNDTLSAAEIERLPEGTRLTYLRELATAGKGSLVVGVGLQHAGSRSVEIDRVEGSALVVKVAHDRSTTGDMSAESVVGVTGNGGFVGEQQAEYTVDLAVPAQAEAFEHFQATGDASGLSLESSVVLDGVQYTGGKMVPGLTVKQGGSILKGERVEGDQRSMLDTGRMTEVVQETDRCDLASGNAGFMSFLGDVTGIDQFGIAARGFRMAADWCVGDQTTQEGSTQSEVEVNTPVDGGPQTMRTLQRFDLDDQQELGRSLLDFATPNYDASEVDSSLLPGVGRTEDTVEIECLIDAEGTERAAQMVLQDQEFDMEYGANQHAPAVFRDARRRVAAGEDARTVFAEASAQMGHWGGEDFAEKVRQLSPENTECFTKIDGTGFIGLEANQDLDKKIELLLEDAKAGDEEARKALWDIAEMEALRGDSLHGIETVPSQFVDEENTRVIHRNQRITAGLQ